MTTIEKHAPQRANQSTERHYKTLGGVSVHLTKELVNAGEALEQLIDDLDSRRGLLLHSGYEFPGRYRRYDIGFVDPPIAFTTRGRAFEIEASSARGLPLLRSFARALRGCPEVAELEVEDKRLSGCVPAGSGAFSEEQRTRRPTVLSVLRCLARAMAPVGGGDSDEPLGFYGAFGYDLVFQFEELERRQSRHERHRELVLYVPDQVIVRDQLHATAHLYRYEFAAEGCTSKGLPRTTEPCPFRVNDADGACPPKVVGDHAPGAFAEQVRRAKQAFAAGDLFEVTPGQTFSLPCRRPPSSLFRQLARENPAPFAFLANLGQGEYLVGASPEMFVRVRGRQVETCPIAGTIARGNSALVDADRAVELLRCEKSTAELTMCTDVDRNDKARICEPGSVRILGRRQLEFYSRLIHTVDHVEGRLRAGFDALDALVTHCWAVTVTGAPKLAAMQFIEDHEASPRRFYGGAVGALRFDGSLSTGLTLRTIHIEGGQAHVRAGATLLHASDPVAEEAECRLKASALLAVLQSPKEALPTASVSEALQSYKRRPRVLLVDHQDSFVHTLADYFRQAGADVTTLRSGFGNEAYQALQPELVVLSPGPGRPRDFNTAATLELAVRRGVPVFGVCLGLQAIVEYFEGQLSRLTTPHHGRASPVECVSVPLFRDLPRRLNVGRYHSLYVRNSELPACLEVTARSLDDDCVMALQHRSLPVVGVQFHPESLLSGQEDCGLKMISNVLHSFSGAQT